MWDVLTHTGHTRDPIKIAQEVEMNEVEDADRRAPGRERIAAPAPKTRLGSETLVPGVRGRCQRRAVEAIDQAMPVSPERSRYTMAKCD